MSKKLQIYGEGGKGGSARQAVEADNTLRTQTIVNVLEVISEGEVVGLENGWKDVYLNQIPVENADGTLNFTGVSGEFRNGLPSQTSIPKFEEVTAVFPLNTAVTNDGVSDGSVTQDIRGTGISAASITIQLDSGLAKLDKESGDLNGHEVNYKIWVKQLTPVLGAEILALDYTLEGKSTTTYQLSHRIDPPASSDTWQFRVERISLDDADTTEKSVISIARWTEIQEPNPPLTYPDTALAGISIPAEEVGNQIPTRGYLVKGIICQVPSNYNAETKIYSGAWNGSFISAWTDNPAWVLYDIVTNQRYGIGEFLGQEAKVDKWSFYDAGVYCDGRVESGLGDDPIEGGEPRFTFNAVIQKQSIAWQLLQAMASVMRAVVVSNDLNEISLVQDRPTPTSKIITNSNVLGGLFTYASTGIDERPTVCNVTFNDKNDRYLPRTISEPTEDDVIGQAFIDKYGFQQSDLVAYATVTESQARRMAKWVLYSSQYEYDSVAFSLSLNVVGLEVGDVVGVMDNDYITADNTTFLGGRVLTVDGTTITLDHPINLDETGYTFSVMASNYLNLEERTVTNSGITATLELDSALPVGDYELNDFYCFKTGLIEPRLYKITSIQESQDKEYTLTCSFYDPQKWGVVEEGLALRPYNYNIHKPLPAITGLSVIEDDRNDDTLATNLMRLVWDYDPKHLGYEFWIKFSKGTTSYHQTTELFLEFENIPVGDYEISGRAIGLSRTYSPKVTLLYSYGAAASNLLPPLHLRVEDSPSPTTFNSDRVTLGWDYDPANDEFLGSLKDYLVKVYATSPAAFIQEYTLAYERDKNAANYKGGAALYPKELIINDFKHPVREFRVEVYSRDSLGRLSTPASLTISNPAPAMPTGTVGVVEYDVTVTLAPASIIPDISNLITAVSSTPGFDHLNRESWLAKTTAQRSLKGIKYPNVEEGSLYVRFALDDTYSDYDLNWTPEYTVTTPGSKVFIPPDVPTGLAAVSTTSHTKEGAYILRIQLTWTAPLNDTGNYTVSYLRQGQPASETAYVDVSETSYVFSDIPPNDDTYEVSVRANYGQESSAFSPPILVVLSADTTPPVPPATLDIVVGVKEATITWVDDTVSDFKDTQVVASLTNNRDTSPVTFSKLSSERLYFNNLEAGEDWYVWARSRDLSGNWSDWNPSSATGGLAATIGGTAEVVRVLFESSSLGSVGSGSVTPNFDDNTNIFVLTLTGAGVTLNPPTATLGSGQVMEGSIQILGGDSFPPTMGAGWQLPSGGLGAFTSDVLLRFFKRQGDASTKVWMETF